MKAAAMSHRMIEFPVSSGNSHRVKEADVKEVIEPIPDTKPKYLEIEKEDFTGMKKIGNKSQIIHKPYTCYGPSMKIPLGKTQMGLYSFCGDILSGKTPQKM